MAPPTVDTSSERRAWVLLFVDLVFAAGVTTQWFAARFDFQPHLGRPIFDATTRQECLLLAIGVACEIGVALLIAYRRWWRLAPVCWLLGITSIVAGRAPVYAPYRIVVWAYAYRRYRWITPYVLKATGVFVAAAVVAMGSTFGVWYGRRRRVTSGSHGTAQWGDPAMLVQRDGLMIGRTARSKVLRYAGDGHLITVAPTRSGKGVGVAIPNLLTYPGPVVATDPKGENYAVTGAQRRKLGVPVYALDPFDSAGGRASFNPLDLIDIASDTANDDAWLIADMLVVGSDRGGEHLFWDEEARAMLTGLILHVCAEESGPQRTLARVRALLSSSPEEFAGLMQVMAKSQAVGGLIARAAHRFMGADVRLRANVVTSAQNHVHFLDSPAIARVTSTSTVPLKTLVEDRASLYLILPPDRMQTHRAWLRVMIASALRAAMGSRVRGAHRTLFLLDEFANLGPMGPVQQGISIAGGYGVTFWLLLQDLAQLRRAYGEGAQTFIANADVLQAFGVNDLETAEHLSRLAGDQTVTVASVSRSSGVSRGRGGSSQQGAAETVSEHGRRLITADEVRRLPLYEQLLFCRGAAPLRVGRLDYRVDREFVGLASPNPLYMVARQP